jgi:ADP-dependent NAD(P)H-hydrate dehydratase / NAD(P)H-hydrate epimerase
MGIRETVEGEELLTPAQMRAIEAAAIASGAVTGAVTGAELMERAGRAVVEAIFAEWPTLAAAPHRAAVLCGPGNNGGDGFVIARLLRDWGWSVDLFHYGDPGRLPPDAAAARGRFVERGGTVTPWEPAAVEGIEADLVVDALFGGGLARAVPEEVRYSLAELQGRWLAFGTPTPLVAVDGPSGICLTSGRALALDVEPPMAALTVTFHRPRTGHCLSDGMTNSGRLVVADIGLEAFHAAGDGSARARLAGPSALKRLARHVDANKYSHGHALVLAGGLGRTGAARLAARGALRVGAGLVTLATPPEALPEVAAQVTAIMCAPVADAHALAEVLEDARIRALCLGPGLGVDRARALLPVCLGAGGLPQRPVVLDADALTALAEAPDLGAALHPGCVLTPHGGEFRRLFPDIFDAYAKAPGGEAPMSKAEATRMAAARAGCVVLFKGADTVIADPSGRTVIHAAVRGRAAPWLATAGAGDVLAGMIAGLVAQDHDPFAAAEAAAWLHVEAARLFGPGLIAEDLPEELPGVFRALGL